MEHLEYLDNQNKKPLQLNLDPKKNKVVNGSLIYSYMPVFNAKVLTSLLFLNKSLFSTYIIGNTARSSFFSLSPGYLSYIDKEKIPSSRRFVEYQTPYVEYILAHIFENRGIIIDKLVDDILGDVNDLSTFKLLNKSNFYFLNKDYFLNKIRVSFSDLASVANASIKILKETFDNGVILINDFKLTDFISKDQYQVSFIDIPIDLIITKDKYIVFENLFKANISFNINFYINLLDNEIN